MADSAVPVLTILFHPSLDRVGQRFFWEDFESEEGLSLAREAVFGRSGEEERGTRLEQGLLKGDLEIRTRGEIFEITDLDSGLILKDGERMQWTRLDLARGVVLQFESLVLEVHLAHSMDHPDIPEDGLIGESESMTELRRDLLSAAEENDAPVIIFGEPGTGKTTVAKAIHRLSKRSNYPFLHKDIGGATVRAVDFSTQAMSARGGVLLLDGLDQLSPKEQSVFLSLLGKMVPVFNDSNVRLMLEVSEAHGKPRMRDLPILLGGRKIVVPALFRRRDDIGRLIVHHLPAMLSASQKSEALGLDASIVGMLARHDYRSCNIQELRIALQGWVEGAIDDDYSVKVERPFYGSRRLPRDLVVELAAFSSNLKIEGEEGRKQVFRKARQIIQREGIKLEHRKKSPDWTWLSREIYRHIRQEHDLFSLFPEWLYPHFVEKHPPFAPLMKTLAERSRGVLWEWNQDAADLFASVVDPGSSSWKRVLTEEQLDRVRNFFGGRSQFDRIYADLEKAAVAKPRPIVRFWVYGPPGGGKTTLLLQLYFDLVEKLQQGGVAPEPLLFAVSEYDAERLLRLPEGAALERLVHLWLEARLVPQDGIESVAPAIVKALRTGTVVLLLDGLDELAAARIRTGILRELFSEVRLTVCVGRSEFNVLKRALQPEPMELRLPNELDQQGILNYLNTRPKRFQAAVAEIRKHILYTGGSQIHPWLSNLRFLGIVLERYDREAARIPDLLRGEEQMQVIEAWVDKAVGRLERIYGKERLKRELLRNLTPLAEKTLISGQGWCDVHPEPDGSWPVWLEASELIEFDQERRRVRIRDEQLTDYLMARRILDDLRHSEQLPFIGIWRHRLLLFLRRMARAWDSSDFVEPIWRLLGRQSEGREGERDPFLATNLVHLLLSLGQRLSNQLLDRLSLIQLDFRNSSEQNVEIAHTSFAESDLTHANLSHVRFVSCIFEKCNLQGAQAEATVFRDCTFSTEDAPGAGFEGMEIGDAVFEACFLVKPERMEKPDHTRMVELLTAMGASNGRFRYKGLFGEVFDKRRELLLGLQCSRAERIYWERIRDLVGRIPKGRPATVIDLMAGRGHQIENYLLARVTRPDLTVIAIDRKAESLRSISDPRLRSVEETVGETTSLRRLLGEQAQTDRADLVIGQKAIHEVPAQIQRKLLAEIAEVLSPHGHLVLYLDAPFSMSPEGCERLARISAPLRNAVPPTVDQVESLLCPPGLQLGEGEDDAAMFLNLWVLVKDWAAGNERERRFRYFSSLGEVCGWATDQGLVIVEEPEKSYYVLKAIYFNESGINEYGRWQRTTARLRTGARSSAVPTELLVGSEEQLTLRQFEQTHLWDLDANQPTPLGRTLGADRASHQMFDRLLDDSSLRDIEFGLDGFSFHFPVYIVTFRKPE